MVAHSAPSRQANDLRLHRTRLAGGAKILAVGHHAWRDGAGRWRLDILVDYLATDAFAVAFAVGHVDVVVLVDVVRRGRAVDRAIACVDIPVGIVRRAVHALVDRAVAGVVIVIVIGIRIHRRAGVLVDIRHGPRIDILVHIRTGGRVVIVVGHRPRIYVLVDVRVG